MGDRDNLPELPNGWVWTKVKKVIHIIDYRGRTPPYRDKGIPHIRSSNVRNGKIIWNDLKYVSEETYEKYMTRGIPKKGDLLFTTEAPLGEVALAPEIKFSVAQRMMILRSDVFTSKFLLYQIVSKDFQERLRGKGTGTTVTGVSSRNFKPLDIIVAPLPEQHRIVAKIEELFTQLDAGVELLKKLKAKLKRYRQAVLKAAVEGKLTKDWREAHQGELEPASVLLERILKERRQKWEAQQLAQMKAKGKTPKDDSWKLKYKEPVAPDISDLFELPEGWGWATIEQLSVRVQYGSSAKANEEPNGIPVLRMGNIVEGKLVLNNLKYLLLEHNEFSELLLEPGDLLFNRTNSFELVGKTAVYSGKPNPCSFASYLIRVRFNPVVNPSFVSYYLNSTYGRNWVKLVVSQQVGQANVNGTKLQALAVPLPSTDEQHLINEKVEYYLSIAEELEKVVDKNLKKAEKLRQSILKKAFEGKLVPQDPTDEPADKLLERIKAEKTKRETETKAKKKQKQPKKSQQLDLF